MKQLPLLVSVDGGLGDHVSAEPSIRYLINLYPPGAVAITCAYPRVFKHLGVPIYPHNGVSPEGEGRLYRKLISFPRDGALTQAVSFLVTHAVDYHAMAMLHRILPLAEKTYRLGVEDADRVGLHRKLKGRDPKKLILVHAGKSWRSKTFPKTWWQETADELVRARLEIALVGRRASTIAGDTTGLVDIDCPTGGLDLRDTLTLGELFALVELAPILLSNDSSPIQIAGAFDNWIIMPATCKHPDFVFPYRNGTPHYKTKAIEKRLAIEDQPFEPLRDGAIHVDFEISNWGQYLPDPKNVATDISTLMQRI